MIDRTTPVRFSMGQFIGGLAAICLTVIGAFWGVTALAVGGLRDDVSAIRQFSEKTADSVQNFDKAGIVRLNTSESKLTEQIFGLRNDIGGLQKELGGFRNEMGAFSKLTDGLSTQIGSLQKELQARQASYDDPKAAENFANALKNAGVDGSKIIVVPWGAPQLSPK